MRLRVSFILVALVAGFSTPAPDKALAFGGYASAPLSVTATAIAGGVRVGWSSPTDGDTGVTGFRVEYSTSGTSGTWSTATTVSSSTFSYDIVGLNQVGTYVRVAATTTAGIGIYGYPWATIYSTIQLRRDSSGNVAYESGYGLSSIGSQASNTYAGRSFSRIKYRLETTISSTSTYAEADFYSWPSGGATGSSADSTAPSIAGIAIPSVNTGQQWIVQANVSDMNVYSNNSAVTKAAGASGRLEIWPWDYGWGPSSLTPAGSSGSFDFGDSHSGGGNYGSFQVHDVSNSKPVFVWNNTGYSNYYTAEVAYGANPVANPDWTFCSQGGSWGSCPTPTSFKLTISINPSVTPLADTTAPTVSRIDARSIAKNGDTITVRSTEAGTAYLVNSSVSVSSVASITSASTSNKNSVSVVAATNTTLTISSLADGTYNLYAADVFNNLSAAVAGTIRIDNSAPTASSIAVNASGTAILLTASETITNSAQVTGIYTVSDGGTSLSVTSTSYSGLVATLSLNRAIPAGANVTFAYTPSSGAATGRWIDLAGNELAAISSRTITNNSASTISVTLTAPSTIYKGVVASLSLSVGAAGKVTFTVGGKRIAGCISRSATGSTPITVTCSWKPPVQGNQILGATLYPSTAGYATTSASSINRYVLKRSNTR
jgi:hypothetical protein